MADKDWYSIELFKKHTGALKTYLREADIYFEPSEVGPIVYFTCHMTEDECEKANKFLDDYFESLNK